MTNLSFKNILLIQKDPWLAKIVVLGREVAWLTGKSGSSGSCDLSSNPGKGKYLSSFSFSVYYNFCHQDSKVTPHCWCVLLVRDLWNSTKGGRHRGIIDRCLTVLNSMMVHQKIKP